MTLNEQSFKLDMIARQEARAAAARNRKTLGETLAEMALAIVAVLLLAPIII